MRRPLLLVTLPFLLAFAACGDGGAPSTQSGPTRERQPAATTAPPAALDGEGFGFGTTDEILPDDPAASTTRGVLSSLSPLSVLGGLEPSTEPAPVSDPTLDGQLITLADLPGDYMSMGTYSYSMPTEFGTVDVAANLFAPGDIAANGEFSTMVISMALTMTPELRAELNAAGGLSALTEAGLEQELGEAAQLGMVDIEVLDGSGLGAGGAGMHLTMDFSTLISAFGAPEEEAPFTSISMEWYAFLDGERLLMVDVMWPGSGTPPLDARGLAETMDARGG
jgi:hypothetical protein